MEGRTPVTKTSNTKALHNEIARLKRNNDRLTLKLQKAEGIIELQKKIPDVRTGRSKREKERLLMDLVFENQAEFGARMACEAFDVSEATYYREKARRGSTELVSPPETPFRHHRRLTQTEETEVLNQLTSEKFIDLAPEEVCATLLDEGKYLCSPRTMYRILKANKAVRERRNQLRHPIYVKPELLATGPNQLWSWDITKLKTHEKWKYFHLYVIIDVFSRCIVGWLIAPRESQELAKRLIDETCKKQGIEKEQLTIHADRGAAMKSKAVSQLMADLGVCRTHSRPHVSNDNPYSESQFKTLKYHSSFPSFFPTLESAKTFLREWFHWYNEQHHHSGICMMTPKSVHTGEAKALLEKRRELMRIAYDKNPERFVHGIPQVPDLPTEVWINKPQKKTPNKNIPIEAA